MGNPHPTRSKPCKIGRKHSGAKSEKVKQRRRNAAKQTEAMRVAVERAHRKRVAAYWSGEADEYPDLKNHQNEPEEQ